MLLGRAYELMTMSDGEMRLCMLLRAAGGTCPSLLQCSAALCKMHGEDT